jgi:hypothetical protein
MTAFLLVRSQRKDMSDNAGNRESRTRGMVSPTMTQKATMPPNALHAVNTPLPYSLYDARTIAIAPAKLLSALTFQSNVVQSPGMSLCH